MSNTIEDAERELYDAKMAYSNAEQELSQAKARLNYIKVSEGKKMKFRLTILPAVEVTNREINFLFKTKEELLSAHNTAADLLIFLGRIKAMADHSNAFVDEELVNGEWTEIEDEWHGE